MRYIINKIHEYPLEKNLIKKGINLHQLAKDIGMDYSHLHRIKMNKMHASEDTAKKIINYFKKQ